MIRIVLFPRTGDAFCRCWNDGEYIEGMTLTQHLNQLKLFTALAAAAIAITTVGCADRSATNADGSFKITPYTVGNLAFSCGSKNIKPLLKDPNSFREIDHSYTSNATHIDVTVNYTATNSFGGRIRGTKTCSYTL